MREDGTVIEPTTGDIAARLGVAAGSMERDELNHALRVLRERGLLRYERDAGTGVICWRLSHDGWGIARALVTGVTGRERSTDDRSRDRYAQARDGTVGPRLPGR